MFRQCRRIRRTNTVSAASETYDRTMHYSFTRSPSYKIMSNFKKKYDKKVLMFFIEQKHSLIYGNITNYTFSAVRTIHYYYIVSRNKIWIFFVGIMDIWTFRNFSKQFTPLDCLEICTVHPYQYYPVPCLLHTL